MPGKERPLFRYSLLAPRHWLAWLGVAFLRLIARLPYRVLYWLGQGIGMLFAYLPTPRRRIARININLCFPQLTEPERQALLRAHLRDIGMMLVELALGWMGSDRALAKLPVQIEGIEHLQAAQAAGRGALLFTGHFSPLEISARLLSKQFRIAGMYREMKSAVFEWAILRARLGYAEAMFDKNDLRGTITFLRAGGGIWYAPDQTIRGKKQVFVPFFNIPTANTTGTHHLARLSNALVFPFFHRRLPNGQGYILRIGPALQNFPSENLTADTATVVACIEQMVREAPEQYLWVHKRFKIRPHGLPKVY